MDEQQNAAVGGGEGAAMPPAAPAEGGDSAAPAEGGEGAAPAGSCGGDAKPEGSCGGQA